MLASTNESNMQSNGNPDKPNCLDQITSNKDSQGKRFESCEEVQTDRKNGGSLFGR